MTLHTDAGTPAEPTRRAVLRGAAWAAPAVLLATAIPAAAASTNALTVTMTTTGLAAGGYDLNLREAKNTNSNTNTSRTNTLVVVATFVVRDQNGVPVPGATVTIATGNVRDSQGHLVLAVSPMSSTSFVQASPQRLASTVLVSDASGNVQVKVSTTTFGAADCAAGTADKVGALSVSAAKATYATGTLALSTLVYNVGTPTC